MPAPVHNPAAQAPPHMTHTPDPQPPAHTPDPQPPAHTPAATTTARPRIRDQIAENPLTSFFGAVIIVMVGFTLTASYDRITRFEDKIDTRFAQVDARFDSQDEEIDARFAAQDERIDARFAQVSARFDSLESDVGEINLKLTALIAVLNATGPVDAAIEGRLAGASTAGPTDEAR